MNTNLAKATLANPLSTKEIALACAHAAEDKKASDVVVLDVSKLTSFADYFVICSAPSERQVQAIVKNAIDELRDQKVRPLGTEGTTQNAWVLVDFGDVVFHCFTDSAREYYDLEGFWIDAPRLEVK